MQFMEHISQDAPLELSAGCRLRCAWPHGSCHAI